MITKKRAFLGLFFAVSLALTGCSSTPVVVNPRSFTQPSRFGFLCFNTALTPNRPVALSMCNDVGTTGLPTPGFELHSLVVQGGRGEIAAVDLTTNTLLDSDTTVPGFTFIAAGDAPVDIAIPTELRAGETELYAYVANHGTKDIWSIPTSRFRVTNSPVIDMQASVSLPGAPIALVITPDNNFLIAAVENSDTIYQIAIGAGGALGAPTAIAVGAATPSAQVDPGNYNEPYERICTTQALEPTGQASPPEAPVTLTGTHKLALTIDKSSTPPRLLVADNLFPRIEIRDLNSDGVGAVSHEIGLPFSQTALAVSPTVPQHIDGTGEARFLYAIDHHGDVRVIDYNDASPTFGAVLPVAINSTGHADRLDFGSPALSLAVVTPSYNEAMPAAGLCVPGNGATVGPSYLRGVFLAVGVADGSTRMVDVYDLDAACRGQVGECASSPGPNSDDAITFLRRHRPRVGSLLTVPVEVVNVPTFSSKSATWTLDSTGRTNPVEIPDLTSLGSTCGTSRMVEGFPVVGSGDPVICVVGDPWSALSQGWSAVYQGPFVSGIAGAWNGTHVQTTINLCDAGVLSKTAAANAPIGSLESTSHGDALMIVGDLPLSAAPSCAIYNANDATTGRRLPVAFEILSASQNSLELGVMIDRPDISGSARDLATVESCFGTSVAFAVVPVGAYTVLGQYNGFVHRITTMPSGTECIVDPNGDALAQSRAVPGVRFENREVAFQIATTPDVPWDARLDFTIGNVPPELAISVGQIPLAMAYSSPDGCLYVVDGQTDGLVRLALVPFAFDHSFD